MSSFCHQSRTTRRNRNTQEAGSRQNHTCESFPSRSNLSPWIGPDQRGSVSSSDPRESVLIRGRSSVLGFQHDVPQRPIDSRLVAGPLLLEPGQHISVDAQRHGLLDRPVQTADLRYQIMRPLPLGGRSLQRADLPSLRNPNLPYHLRYTYITVHIKLPLQNVPRGTQALCSQCASQLT